MGKPCWLAAIRWFSEVMPDADQMRDEKRERSMTPRHARLGLLYAWSGVAIMWVFWVSFVIFLAAPRQLDGVWPLPTVEGNTSLIPSWMAALVDIALIAVFGLQHSLMARPWFKQHVMAAMPPAFQRVTYVHFANVALFALILFWQPIPSLIWDVRGGLVEWVVWTVFAIGWLILFFGAWSMGLGDLLGLEEMRAWAKGSEYRLRLKTGGLYRWLRHPMYVGVLLGVWATPNMSLGHLLLASGLTLYVIVAMRYEKRDLIASYGDRYVSWTARS